MYLHCMPACLIKMDTFICILISWCVHLLVRETINAIAPEHNNDIVLLIIICILGKFLLSFFK